MDRASFVDGYFKSDNSLDSSGLGQWRVRRLDPFKKMLFGLVRGN